ncbi:protein serine/threonine kinase, putative, partial [Entamoeba invadens IP1]
MCVGCKIGYVPNITTSLQCIICTDFDINCVECVTDERKCKKCKPGMYPDEQSGACKSCDTTCDSQCETFSGICTGCSSNHIFNDPKDKKCATCSSFDSNCSSCSSDFTRKCTLCNTNYYPDITSNKCVECNTIDNCKTCSPSNMYCLTCQDPYIQKNGMCESCPIGFFKESETKCGECYNFIEKCNLCDTLSVGKAKCTKCIYPFAIKNGKCDWCGSGELNDKQNGVCINTNNSCYSPTNNTFCIKCGKDAFLSNGSCVVDSNCESDSSLSLTSCDCSSQISTNSKCMEMLSKCKYQKSFKQSTSCISCEDDNILNEGKCVGVTTNEVIRNQIVYMCETGKYLTVDNKCQDCDSKTMICTNINNLSLSLLCKPNYIFTLKDSLCSDDTNCASIKNNECVKCYNDNFEVSKGKCTKCKNDNCALCVGGKCQMCSANHLMYSDNQCVAKELVNCMSSSHSGCTQCKEEFYQIDGKNVEGKYEFCAKTEAKLRCKYYSPNQLKCIECLNAYSLKNGICAETFDDETFEEENQTEAFNSLKGDLKTQETVECQIRNNKGCQRCYDGYFLSNTLCVKCLNDCLSCFNSSYCTSCSSEHFLDLFMKCQTLGNLARRCEISLPSGIGCAICKMGYYKTEKDCNECDSSCHVCVKKDECLSCKEGYFKISTESTKLCLSNSTLNNCTKSTSEGCVLCEESFYLQNGRCFVCENDCLTCRNGDSCETCRTDHVLVGGRCVHYTTIEHCTQAENSQCVACEGSNRPSDDGESCVNTTNYGVVIGIPVAVLIVFFILIAIILVVVLFINTKKKEKMKMKNICVFKMKRSNIDMDNINSVLLSNKKSIKFNLNNDNPIPVDKETRDLICIGNQSKRNMKVQFSVIEGCDSYQIRTVPSIITLKRGEACEFEIFIKPLCSCKIEENVMVTSLDITTGNVVNAKIGIDTTTQQTTKLNYKELDVITKLGEGSFGIVYMGNYKGNLVAIKKMKQIASTNTLTNEITDEKKSLQEFENEVNMLDKFRSDYIVHFYGAVFIPNKVCMVTEYAQFGSLNDILKHKKSDEVETRIRVKIILDGARGIQYLHENGILHRDIKPDNIS